MCSMHSVSCASAGCLVQDAVSSMAITVNNAERSLLLIGLLPSNRWWSS